MPPPKARTIGKPAAVPKSASQALVATGPKHVSTNAKGKVKTGPTEKPTTTRALILRNGKAGARGTGELVLVSKLTGREKLDLLAEDLQNRFTSAVMSPFHLERCLKIAESQYSAALDDIASLRDFQLFKPLIEGEIRARSDLKKPGFKFNAEFVAEVIGNRIHNAYTLASAWKLITRQLYEIASRGVTDGQIKEQLRRDEATRAHFLVLYDLVTVIVEMTQAKFSLLATTSTHYKRYFKEEKDDNGEKQIKFDWAGLKEAARDFMDSIIIELCFPRSPYDKAILYQVLREAVEESPKEAKRFPQPLWDALGDLSVIVELQTLLEAPLVQPDGQSWKNARRTMTEDYDDWVDAQIYSEKAAAIHNYKDIVFPLDKTKSKAVVDNVWKYIDLNYKSVVGEGIDALWGLSEDLVPTPQWHAFYIPSLDNMSDDEDGPRGLKKPIRRLAITDGRADDDSDSMPELQSVSNSSDEDGSDVFDDDSDMDSDSEEESEDSGYDTEQEDELREMLREAMDIAHEADWLNSAKVEGELDPLSEEDRKGNPFLKLLGSLRGRMFSSNPKLKTTERKEPLKAKLGRRFTPSGAPKEIPKGAPPPPKPAEPAKSPAKAKQEAPKSHKATVEEVEDEEEPSTVTKKKKKKPKKKKKSTVPTDTSITEEPKSPSPAISPPTSPKTQPPPPPPKSPAKKGPAANAAPLNNFGSTISLPISEATAQSAHSYIHSENLNQEKTKVKSRPSHATAFAGTPQEKEKKGGMSGMFSKIMGRGKEEEDKSGAKHSWFSRLGKKTKGYMHQLLNTADSDAQGITPMKWENFLKIMREMGFTYDPSTAGSSVRFDPPDPRDTPITFHKPHPDPTLPPIMLKDFAKRLKRHYGWDEADFLKHA